MNLEKFVLLTCFSLLCCRVNAQEVKPEITEDWSVKPPVVAPAKGINKPPSDGIVLFSGKKDLDLWQREDGSAAGWTAAGDSLIIVKKAGNIMTKQKFGSIQLHIEWKTPDPKEDKGNSRGNSGVLFMGLYELQIYESYQYNTNIYFNGQAGSIYKQFSPLVNASAPPQVWQSFDVVFVAPAFNADKTLKSPAFITVFHNGILIHHHVALKGPMIYAGYPEYQFHEARLPLMLQEHDSRVSFRNIWVREL
jgi:hypothetical protein